MSNEKVAVKFLKSWRGYSAGEVAGFGQVAADDLVKGKVAELVKGTGKGSGKGGAAKPGSGKPSPAPDADDDTKPAPDTPPADDAQADDDEKKP